MAFNPFLSMTEPAAPVAAEVLNPFMMTDPEPAEFSGDNPFATSNPFSDFGGAFEPAAGDTVPVDIFGGPDPPGGGARQFDGFPVAAAPIVDIFSSPPEPVRLVKPTELELISTTADAVFGSPLEDQTTLPSRPLPPETQNLILTVTGQMEFTSSHLLDRIPPTRTPSPVSVRDIHSPSPTPEPELELDPEPAPEPAPAPPDGSDVNRNKPARPPPARPPAPPRPAPPPPPQRPAPPATLDDINLFDAPAPTVVKPTKEAILSLYSAPKKEEEKQIDFLSDDISEDVSVPAGVERKQSMIPEVTTLGDMGDSTPREVAPVAQDPAPVMPVQPDVTPMFAASAPVPSEPAAPMDCSEPAGNTAAASPAVANSPFADIANDNFQVDKNPFESIGAADSSTNVFATTAEDTFMTSYGDSFGAAPSDAFGTSPASYSEHVTSDVFGAPAARGGATDMFEAQADAAAWGAAPADAMLHDGAAFPESQDAFDAFSAKFDSTAAQHLNTGE